MAYDRTRTTTQLAIIHHLLPDVVGVTTDLVAGPSGAHDALHLRRGNGRIVRTDISKREGDPGRGLRQLVGNTGLAEAGAKLILDAGRELFSVNPRGSWCAATDRCERTLLLAAFEDERVYSASRFINGMVGRLADLMPEAFTILADVAVVSQPGGGRQRRLVWVRVVDGHDLEMAALDSTALQTHAHDALVKAPHAHLDTNLNRLAVWAGQLGITAPGGDPSDPAVERVHCAGEVMTLLSTLAVMIGADEIWLRS